MVGSPDDDSAPEKSSSDVNAGRQDGEIENIEKQNEELRRNRDFLEEIQEVANIGGWEFDSRSDRFRMTDTIHDILDLPADIDPTPEAVFDFYHPEDREVVSEAFERIITDGTTEDLEVRSVTTDGDVRWIRARGEPWYEDGNIAGARGTVQDITRRKRRESELRYRDEALRELHKTTQDLLNVETESDIVDCLVNHTLAIFDFDHFAVMRFIEADGILQSVATSPEWEAEFDSPLVIEPGPHPVWEVYLNSARESRRRRRFAPSA